MARLTIIVGLPGSGKSEYLRNHSSKFEGNCVSDFHAWSKEVSLQASRHFRVVKKTLEAGKNCLIEDVAFCDPRHRISIENAILAIIHDVEIEWIYFANDLKRCLANIERRHRPNWRAEQNSARHLSCLYVIPVDADVVPVFSNPQTNAANSRSVPKNTPTKSKNESALCERARPVKPHLGKGKLVTIALVVPRQDMSVRFAGDHYRLIAGTTSKRSGSRKAQHARHAAV